MLLQSEMDWVIWHDMGQTETNEPVARPATGSWPQTQLKSSARSPTVEFQLVLISVRLLGTPVTQYHLKCLQQLRTQGDPKLIPLLSGRARPYRNKSKHSTQRHPSKCLVLDRSLVILFCISIKIHDIVHLFICFFDTYISSLVKF